MTLAFLRQRAGTGRVILSVLVLRRRRVLLASHSLRSVRLGAGAQSRKSLNATTSTQCVRDRMRVDASLVGWWSCNSSSPCFLLAFHFLPKPRTRVSKPRWSFIIIYNSDRISDWAACSIWPARAGQPGLSSVSLPGNRLTVSRPALAARASALAAHRCVALWVPRPHPEFCVACFCVRAAGLHGVPGSARAYGSS